MENAKNFRKSQVNKTVDEHKAVINANVEIVTNQAKDVMNAVTGVATGEENSKVKNELREKYRNEITRINRSVEKAKKVLENPKASKAQKDKAESYLKRAERAINTNVAQLKALDNKN